MLNVRFKWGSEFLSWPYRENFLLIFVASFATIVFFVDPPGLVVSALQAFFGFTTASSLACYRRRHLNLVTNFALAHGFDIVAP